MALYLVHSVSEFCYERKRTFVSLIGSLAHQALMASRAGNLLILMAPCSWLVLWYSEALETRNSTESLRLNLTFIYTYHMKSDTYLKRSLRNWLELRDEAWSSLGCEGYLVLSEGKDVILLCVGVVTSFLVTRDWVHLGHMFPFLIMNDLRQSRWN